MTFLLNVCDALPNGICKMNELLFLLPDELWISILDEWIGKPITLCAFDISFCNRLLRQRYFSSWLRAVTFGIFSQIHFEPIFASERFQTKCSCGVFRLVWEEKYFPCLTFLVMRNDEDDSGWKCTIPSKALNAMSFMETLNTSCKATYNKFTNTPAFWMFWMIFVLSKVEAFVFYC